MAAEPSGNRKRDWPPFGGRGAEQWLSSGHAAHVSAGMNAAGGGAERPSIIRSDASMGRRSVQREGPIAVWLYT